MARHWGVIGWIACLAILFNAFAPIVSHAGGSRTGAPVAVGMEVCTALGMETIKRSDTAVPAVPDHDHLHKSMSHCGFCVAHAASHALPPPLTAMFMPGAGRAVHPPLSCHSPRPLFPWSLAQPRAPPRLA
jgi:hypothetical protein